MIHDLTLQRFSPFGRWVTVVSLIGFVVFQFVLQGLVGVLEGQLREEFGLGPAALGVLSSTYYYPYLLMQIPVGMIYDRRGLKSVSICALAGVLFCLWGFQHATSLGALMMLRAAMGGCAAFGFVGMLVSLHKLVPRRGFTLCLALAESVAMVSVGQLQRALAQTAEQQGWRAGVGMLLGVGWVMWGVYAVLGREAPLQRSSQPGAGASPALSVWFVTLMQTLRLPAVWAAGLFSGLVFAVISVFVVLWGVPFLQYAQGVESAFAATELLSYVYVGVGLGSPLVGLIGSRVRVLSLIRVGQLICICGFLVLATCSLGETELRWLLLLIGLCCSVYQFGFVYIARDVPAHQQGVASGAANMAMMAIAPAMQVLSGSIVAWCHTSEIFVGWLTPMGPAYRVGVMLIPLGLFVGLFLTTKIRDEVGLSPLAWLRQRRPLPPVPSRLGGA